MIKGNEILIYFNKPDGYALLGCDRSVSISFALDFLRRTNFKHSKHSFRIPGNLTITAYGNGLLDYNSEMSGLYLQNQANQRTRIKYKIIANNGDGVVIYEGFGFVRNARQVGNVSGMSVFSYSLISDGTVNIDSTVPQQPDENLPTNVLMNKNGVYITDKNDTLIIP